MICITCVHIEYAIHSCIYTNTIMLLYTLTCIYIPNIHLYMFTELYPDAVAKHCSAVCQSLALTLIQSTAHMSPALKKAYLDGLGQLAKVYIVYTV